MFHSSVKKYESNNVAEHFRRMNKGQYAFCDKTIYSLNHLEPTISKNRWMREFIPTTVKKCRLLFPMIFNIDPPIAKKQDPKHHPKGCKRERTFCNTFYDRGDTCKIRVQKPIVRQILAHMTGPLFYPSWHLWIVFQQGLRRWCTAVGIQLIVTQPPSLILFISITHQYNYQSCADR